MLLRYPLPSLSISSRKRTFSQRSFSSKQSRNPRFLITGIIFLFWSNLDRFFRTGLLAGSFFFFFFSSGWWFFVLSGCVMDFFFFFFLIEKIGTELGGILRERYGKDNVVLSDVKKLDVGRRGDGPFRYIDVTKQEMIEKVKFFFLCLLEGCCWRRYW